MNTRIDYMYRDADNYKTFSYEIIAGELELGQIRPFLYEQEFFIPSQVGLPDLQGSIWTNADHVWHTIEGLFITVEQPTVSLDAKQLLRSMRKMNSEEWNLTEVFRQKGLM